MNFLYPQFLFGLLAISIPIVIHFFNLQRPKKILFPNVKFLKQVQQISSNKLKIKHLLVLLSRICFIIFLAFAFAQPFIVDKSANSFKGTSLVSLYLDNSFSMQNELAQEKALDLGIKSVQKLTEIFPGTTSYNLLTNDFEGKDQFFKNKDKLNERISEINFSNTYRDALSVLKRQHQLLLEQGAENKHIIWFSDFQKSTLGDLSLLPFDTTIHYHLVPVQNREVSNVSVDSVWLSNPMVKMGENNTLQIKLRNSGTKDVRELTLKLYMDDIQVSSTVVDIPSESYASASFVFNINGEGQKKASIRFEDYPIVFDNEYFLTLNVSPKIAILHLYDKEEGYISKVYENESVFKVENSPIGDFDYSKISTTNLIVLDGLKNIPEALFKPLQDHVETGGSLLVFPAKEGNSMSYEKFSMLFHLQNPEMVRPDTTHKLSYEMEAPDFSNPFFNNVFEKKDPNMMMPFAYPILKWERRGGVLLRFKNGETFLSSISIGKGQLYLATTPLDDKLTNLQRHSIFVPLMYKIAFNSIVSTERLSYSFQEPSFSVDIDKEDKSSNAVYHLEAKNFDMIPLQRKVGGKLIVDLPSEQMRAGFYNLTLNGKVEKVLALNYGKKESVISAYNNDELKEMTENHKNVKIYSSETSNEFADTFRQDNIGVPLWKYFLIGALLFLMLEILLIRFL
ncbi:MAG TPA: BatA domain-containing protein [Cytophagaceae bacterium]|nr:BatA domain-containing protein [Cytophagaceae bacterium]